MSKSMSKKNSDTARKGEAASDGGMDRRSVVAIITGGLAMLAPVGAGVWSFLSPLFRKASVPEVRVALLDQVPDDGKPHFFPVVADRKDAWTQYSEQKIGSVYLVRQPGEGTPTAYTAKCPHAGCSIGYSAEEEKFKCPCHTSAFGLDGARVNGDEEVAPRDMDTLDVKLQEIDAGEGNKVTEVLVTFVDYKTGHAEKILSE